MATTAFYAEDTVCLKQDPSIIATVEVTWREVNSGALSLDRRSWIVHNAITMVNAARCIDDMHPPTGHVVIRFIDPYTECTLIKEEDLILLDRALTLGDVIKRSPTDSQSGTVLKASQTCLIEPIYKDLSFMRSVSWPHKAEDNKLWVSAEDLSAIDYETGDRVLFQDWVGEVVDTTEEVAIRLGNGSIVKVEDSEQLMVPDYNTKTITEHRWKQDLPTTLKEIRTKWKQEPRQGKKHLTTATEYWPGLEVTTTKANLRLGVWLVGKYNPSEQPRGVVVDVRVTSIQVDWLATKLFDSNRPSTEQPHEIIEWPDLDEVKLYNSKNLTSSDGLSSNDLGSRVMSDVGAGDKIKFRDVPGAAVKYSADAPRVSETGIFRRIPRTMTDGFDMNVFKILQSKTTVHVQWQDGSMTQEPAMNFIPYLNIDDHDVWPGEIISIKSEEVEHDNTVLELKKVGVVQTVDSKERTAYVRWFTNPSISVYKYNLGVLFSDAKLGQISDQSSAVALYDISTYPALSKRRGDLVVLTPGSSSDASGVSKDQTITSSPDVIPNSIEVPGSQTDLDPQNILSNTQIRWFGEVIDLTLEGQLTVRLGALDKVEDICVPIQRVNVIIGGDDPDGLDTDDGDYSSSDDSMDDDVDDWDSISDDQEAIIEETLYEGGERLDDGDEDAWMTDGSESELTSAQRQPKQNDKLNSEDVLEEGLFDAETEILPVCTLSASDERNTAREEADHQKTLAVFDVREQDLTQASLGSKFGLMAYPDMPPVFEMLDGSPTSHQYLNISTPLNSAFLRRIRQEHTVLSNSLPEGIWVRTWSERLDLVQVLILGPRGTPYSLAPFLFDFRFKADYPNSAPATHFHSWTNGVGRINPNLYEDGNVCLSVLGTWHGNKESESWSRENSSLLQVLVSLLGLVLVEQPYYNEAGFDTLVPAEESLVPARIYAEKALCLSKGFIAHALTQGCEALTNVVEWLYRSPQGPRLITPVVAEIQELLARRHRGDTVDGVVDVADDEKPLSIGAEALLRRYLPVLEGVAKDVGSSE